MTLLVRFGSNWLNLKYITSIKLRPLAEDTPSAPHRVIISYKERTKEGEKSSSLELIYPTRRDADNAVEGGLFDGGHK